MFAFLKSFIPSFWSDNKDADLTLDEAYNILSSNQDENDEELENEKVLEEVETGSDSSDYACFHKTGTITSSKDGVFMIDDSYEFKTTLENLAVGMQVSYIMYSLNSELKISNVAIKDDWSCEGLGYSNKQSHWTSRTLITKVDRREGRILVVVPGDLRIDLNVINSEFVPIVGDWVELQAKVELDECVADLFGKVLEIEKISPLRPRVLEGCIKEWCNETKCGVIDRVVYFNSDALLPGYLPMLGDKVVIQAIESDQGRYTCRALKIIPKNKVDREVSGGLIMNEALSSCEFESEKGGIDVSEHVYLKCTKLGDEIDFKFVICNKLEKDLVLLKVEVASNDGQKNKSQCEIINSDNTPIKGGDMLEIQGLCKVRNAGTTKELVMFSFDDSSKIGRWVTVSLESNGYVNNVKIDRAKTVNKGSLLLGSSKFKLKQIVRGQQITTPPRFISAKLPEYPVPKKLLNIFTCPESTKNYSTLKGEICKAKPCFKMSINFTIYEDYFHTLLHLDEIHQLISIKAYEQDYTLFIRNGEYMMVEIENLSEKRPSLIAGDKIIAKDSYNVDADEYEGFVYKLGAKHAYVKFAQDFHDIYNGQDMSIMVVTSRAPYRRMHQAVGLAMRNLGNCFLFPTKVVQKPPQVNFTYDQYQERKVNKLEKAAAILKRHSMEKKKQQEENLASSSASPTKSKLLLNEDGTGKSPKFQQNTSSLPLTTKLEWVNENLNFYQKAAVRNIILGEARPLPYLIFGPPGTGKTVTLVETILQLIRLIPHARLLVAAPSNSAADLIALRLIESGALKPGDLIRLVAYRCVVEDTLPVKLIPYCATADIARSGTNNSGLNVNTNGLTLGCNSLVIGRHRITVGTCISLGNLYSMGFTKGHFTHVIVDEAGQATEPEIMVPFSLLDISAGQIILAGDPQQLGPVIPSRVAGELGLEETYLDRMLNRFPYVKDSQGFPKTGGYDPRLVTKLVYNYRSLPNVLKLSSDLFYDGQLISTISPTDSKEARLLNSLKELLPCADDSDLLPSVVFHGVLGEECQTPDCPSWFNPNEVSQIFYYVNELYRLGLKSTDIGIISPYIKQVRQIRSLLNEAEFEMPKVGTVEEFQGQEFNVILLSTVRSREDLKEYDLKYKLGFISHPRRVNVAITRAQALMIIIGNPHLLCKDLHWRSVIKYCADSGAYRGCDLI